MDNETSPLVPFALIGLILCFAMGCMIGCYYGTNAMKAQVVERGCAEWKTDIWGNSTFVWKSDPKKVENK